MFGQYCEDIGITQHTGYNWLCGATIQKSRRIPRRRKKGETGGDQNKKHLSKGRSCHENNFYLDSNIRVFPIQFHGIPDRNMLAFRGKSRRGWPAMRDTSGGLTKKSLQKFREISDFILPFIRMEETEIRR
jgi:hypothetical protein